LHGICAPLSMPLQKIVFSIWRKRFTKYCCVLCNQ